MAALLTFILAMLHAPEVQERAQRELDIVTGGRRLPNFSDRASLPYIEAIVKEVLRWHPLVPFGLPHQSRVDDASSAPYSYSMLTNRCLGVQRHVHPSSDPHTA